MKCFSPLKVPWISSGAASLQGLPWPDTVGLLRRCVRRSHMGQSMSVRSLPGLLARAAVDKVQPLGLGILELLPALGQRHPDARPEPLDQGLAVQAPADEDDLVHLGLPLLPRLVAWPVANGLVHALEDELLVIVALR